MTSHKSSITEFRASQENDGRIDPIEKPPDLPSAGEAEKKETHSFVFEREDGEEEEEKKFHREEVGEDLVHQSEEAEGVGLDPEIAEELWDNAIQMQLLDVLDEVFNNVYAMQFSMEGDAHGGNKKKKIEENNPRQQEVLVLQEYEETKEPCAASMLSDSRKNT